MRWYPMNTFTIFDNNSLTQLYVEEEAYEGVKRIGARVALFFGKFVHVFTL